MQRNSTLSAVDCARDSRQPTTGGDRGIKSFVINATNSGRRTAHSVPGSAFGALDAFSHGAPCAVVPGTDDALADAGFAQRNRIRFPSMARDKSSPNLVCARAFGSDNGGLVVASGKVGRLPNASRMAEAILDRRPVLSTSHITRPSLACRIRRGAVRNGSRGFRSAFQSQDSVRRARARASATPRSKANESSNWKRGLLVSPEFR